MIKKNIISASGDIAEDIIPYLLRYIHNGIKKIKTLTAKEPEELLTSEIIENISTKEQYILEPIIKSEASELYLVYLFLSEIGKVKINVFLKLLTDCPSWQCYIIRDILSSYTDTNKYIFDFIKNQVSNSKAFLHCGFILINKGSSVLECVDKGDYFAAIFVGYNEYNIIQVLYSQKTLNALNSKGDPETLLKKTEETEKERDTILSTIKELLQKAYQNLTPQQKLIADEYMKNMK